MSALTLDDLKAAPPLRCEAVPVPEFGEGKEVWLAELSAWEKETRIEVPFAAHKEREGQENNVGLRAFVVAACWCNSDARDFVNSDATAITIAAKKLSDLGAVFQRFWDRVEALNALGTEQVEAIEKN